jgi:hypothetical protein
MGHPRGTLARDHAARVPVREPVLLTSLTLAQRRVVLALLDAERAGRAARAGEPHASTSNVMTARSEERDAATSR